LNRSIHIISFDVPFPADYGGVVDVFYKLKLLSEAGIRVILHCYEYGRGRPKELEKYCAEVNYYSRKLNLSGIAKGYPYIVSSRNQERLLNRLLEDDFPILFEGLHTCFFLSHPLLAHRNKTVRTHNVEHNYYKALGESEQSSIKKIYFYWESIRLKKFEEVLKHANQIASISKSDAAHFSEINPSTRIISAFHSFENLSIKTGISDFILYHGNLSVPENNKAALFILEEIVNDLPYKIIFAGCNPSLALRKAITSNSRAELKENLCTEEIHNLVAAAQINLLPTFQATGIKLKLLAALFTGRHCIVNSPMVEHTGLEILCKIGNSPAELKALIKAAMEKELSREEINFRQEVLIGQFSSTSQLKLLMDLIGINHKVAAVAES
jgi:hypothetical protein